MTRELRDVLAEAMRRERYNLISPDWRYCDEAMREPIRERADFLIKMLADAGVTLAMGDQPAEPLKPPYNPVITTIEVAPGASRLVRAVGGARFEIVLVADGTEAVEHSFTMLGVMGFAERIMLRDATVQKEQGLLTKLAGAIITYWYREGGGRPE